MMAKNILNRQFNVSEPNHAWVSDITYIDTSEGWLYLAIVMDLYSSRIIGYSMSDNMSTKLTVNALQKALELRGYPRNVIVHTDQGIQYACQEYKSILTKYGLIGSMSRKGNCWDNAIAENFFGIMKNEYIYQVKFATRHEARVRII